MRTGSGELTQKSGIGDDMINEGRVRRMARMAAYEQEDGVRDEKINAYFRGDYITKQILITFICATIAFVILFAGYGIYNFET